jgi:hypothetical protein
MRCTFAAISLLMLVSAPVAGQTAFFVEGGAMTAAGASEFQAGLRGSPTVRDGTGIDFAVATLPAFFSQGLVLVMSELDATIHRPLSPSVAVAIRLGGTAVFGAGSEGGGAALGINAGGGLIFNFGSRLLFRLDYTHRWFMSDGAALGLSSFTVGIGVGN